MRCFPISQETHTTPSFSLETGRLSEVVHQLALDTFQELGVVLAIGILTAPFMVGSVSWITVELSGCLILSLIARTLVVCFAALGQERCRVFAMRLSSFCFIPATLPLQILIHEMGHVIAAHLLFTDVAATIHIHPAQGGSTSTTLTGLSLFGQLFGMKWAQGLVAAAGPLCGLTVAAFLLHQALQSPEWGLAESHRASACLSHFRGQASYALSAAVLPPDAPLSHDYVHLRSLGIHPILVTMMICAIPILIWQSTQSETTA